MLALFALCVHTGCTLGGLDLNANQKKLPKDLGKQINTAYDVKAKAILRGAMVAAEIYCAESDGTYSGMDAAALSQIDPNIKFTDGQPKEDVVSVTASADSYTMTISTRTGKTLRAAKKLEQKDAVFDWVD